MFAILTKRLPITNTKPARIKAYMIDRSVTISWPMSAQSDLEAHFAAAQELLFKHGKTGLHWYGGEIKGGYAFVTEGRNGTLWNGGIEQ